MFDFLDFNLLDVLDIVLVALLLYYAYRLVRGTAAINIFVGIVILYLIWKITDALNMELLSNILGGFMSVGVFALIVVFQQEIRRLLLMLGSSNLANRKKLNRYLKIFNTNQNTIEPELDIDELIQSCASLKKTKNGSTFGAGAQQQFRLSKTHRNSRSNGAFCSSNREYFPQKRTPPRRSSHS